MAPSLGMIYEIAISPSSPIKVILLQVDFDTINHRLVTDLHYYSSPYPSILSCSLDGSVVQRVHSGEGRVLCSDRGCLNSCVLDPIMGLVATGGQKGELTMVYPI